MKKQVGDNKLTKISKNFTKAKKKPNVSQKYLKC